MKKKLAFALVLTLLLTGCGGGKSIGAMGGEWAPAEYEKPGTGLNFSAVNGSYADDGYFVEPEAAPDLPAGGGEAPLEPVSDKLIYRADLTVETVDFDAAVAALEDLAVKLGGFIEASDVTGYTNRYPDGTTKVVDRRADYVLRVPSAKFKETINHVGELGSVTNSSSGVENITSRFIDQDARKHSLEVQEERLLAMLEKAEDVYVLVELENRLSEVRYEIESIERTLRNWQQQVDYSTVRVCLREVAVYTPTASVRRTFSEKLSDALSDGWSGFVRGLERFILAVAEGLPAILLFTAVLAAVIAVLRKLRRRKKSRKQGTSPTADQPPKDEQ